MFLIKSLSWRFKLCQIHAATFSPPIAIALTDNGLVSQVQCVLLIPVLEISLNVDPQYYNSLQQFTDAAI